MTIWSVELASSSRTPGYTGSREDGSGAYSGVVLSTTMPTRSSGASVAPTSTTRRRRSLARLPVPSETSSGRAGVS